MKLCCLCQSSADPKRVKRLHGPACAVARDVLEELASSLKTFSSMRNPVAVLCYSCELCLKNIKKLEEKVVCLKAEVNGRLSALEKIRLNADTVVTKHMRVEAPHSCGTSELADNNWIERANI